MDLRRCFVIVATLCALTSARADQSSTFGLLRLPPLAVPQWVPNAPAGGSAGDQDLIDGIHPVSIRDLLSVISKYAGVNILISDTVTGNVKGNMQLRGLPPEEAIQSVTSANHLQYYRYEDDTYLIGKNMVPCIGLDHSIGFQDEYSPQAYNTPDAMNWARQSYIPLDAEKWWFNPAHCPNYSANCSLKHGFRMYRD